MKACKNCFWAVKTPNHDMEVYCNYYGGFMDPDDICNVYSDDRDEEEEDE